MANQGHYGGDNRGTRQGIYICAPSGAFLASINSTNPDRVLKMLREGLEAWRQLPKKQRRLSASSEIKPAHRWEDSYPANGLILSMITRDLPEQCNPLEPCEVKWNQDQVWFTQEESRQWLPANPQAGEVHSVPPELVARLARFHLVDTVKGQSATFSRGGVEDSTISTEMLEREGSTVKLKITGLTQGVTGAGWWRESSNGVVSRLLGEATYDLDNKTFVEFELVALGRRWGATNLNGRRRGAEQGPLGFVFRLAPAGAVPIAPAFIGSYNADWVKTRSRN